jgi:hypothetical protein
MPEAEKLFEFKFYDGQVFRSRGRDERDALRRIGLEAYNPVAYDVREIVETTADKKQD